MLIYKLVWGLQVRTSSRLYMIWFLCVNQEDNIPLRGIDVSILEKKYPVYPIFLEDGELHK